MKIYIHYNITDKPWGGGNSFLKAFRYYCIKNNIELAKSINDDYDILFFNAAHKSQGKFISIDELLNIKQYGATNKIVKKFKNTKKKLLLYRSDGFRDEYTSLANDRTDEIQKLSLQLSSHIIFQNNSSLTTASRNHIGYCKKNYSIIYNGVNQELFKLKDTFWNKKDKLKIFSANWSSNHNKGYKIIAEFSELENIELTFCGNWPNSIDKRNVKIIPAISQNKLAEEYCKHDIFLHPSKHDQSPNVCLEAISCGLPIIYHETSGIKEVAGDCGIVVDESDLNNTLKIIIKEYDNLITILKNKRDYYSINRTAKEYIDIFRKVLNESK